MSSARLEILKMVAEGKIRHVGVSNESSSQGGAQSPGEL